MGEDPPVTSTSGNGARGLWLVESVTTVLLALLEALVFALTLLFINWIQSSCWRIKLFSLKAFFYTFLYLPIIVLTISAVVGGMTAIGARLSPAGRQRPKVGDVLIHVYLPPTGIKVTRT